MTFAPVQAASTSPARQQAAQRMAGKPVSPTSRRLRPDAGRFVPRDAASGALPAVPAKFRSPEDFMAFGALVGKELNARKARAAGPKAALDAAQAELARQESSCGSALELAKLGYLHAKTGVDQELASLDAQVAQAQKALDAARRPGGASAGKLQREVAELNERTETARVAIAINQRAIDAGEVEGQARAAAYAAIAMHQHAIAKTQARLDQLLGSMHAETSRTAPDYDPAVRDAAQRLTDLQLRRDRAHNEADLRLTQAQDRVEHAQREYDDQLAPLRGEVQAARVAYAPLGAAVDQARERLLEGEAIITKTQRALWWARGFNLSGYLSELE